MFFCQTVRAYMDVSSALAMTMLKLVCFMVEMHA